MVTAAVHRGFDPELALHHLTFRHWAGVRPYTSTLIFAEPCVFSKQSLPPSLCHLYMVAHIKATLLPKLQVQLA